MTDGPSTDRRLRNLRYWMFGASLTFVEFGSGRDWDVCELCFATIGPPGTKDARYDGAYRLTPNEPPPADRADNITVGVGRDSLDVVEWMMDVEDKLGFKLPNEEPVDCATVRGWICPTCAMDFTDALEWVVDSEHS